MKKTMLLAAASLFAASAAYADFAEGPATPAVVLTGCAFCGVRTGGSINFDNLATASTIKRLCPEGSPAWNEVNGLGPENDLPFQAK